MSRSPLPSAMSKLAVIAALNPHSPSPSPSQAKPAAFPVVNPSEVSRITFTALGVGVGFGGLIALLLAVCIFLCFCRRRSLKTKRSPSVSEHDYFPQPQQWQRNNPPNDNLFAEPIKPSLSLTSLNSDTLSISTSKDGSVSNMTFTFEELARATQNFLTANLLGQGGFGYVHKGVLPNGKEVAIKQLKYGSTQGEREFQAEVDTISKVKHQYLVSLVGYCICGEQRLLVYEFVPNKTLDFHLHEGMHTMSWSVRLKVALGAAKGLSYLHEECRPKIIHRDIKASNILLDDNFEAKVADFGLARFSNDNDTHVSTRVMGTFGYLAPEYASSGKLTDKSDVYSFGVLLLELITGRRPLDKGHFLMDDSMVEWARPLLWEALETGKFEGLMDPNLEESNSSEMSRMVACAASCVQHSARRRPRMSQIVEALEGNLSIDELCGDFSPTSSATCGVSDYDRKDELNRFRKIALESQITSSTSEFSAINCVVGDGMLVSSTEFERRVAI